MHMLCECLSCLKLNPNTFHVLDFFFFLSSKMAWFFKSWKMANFSNIAGSLSFNTKIEDTFF